MPSGRAEAEEIQAAAAPEAEELQAAAAPEAEEERGGKEEREGRGGAGPPAMVPAAAAARGREVERRS